MAEILSDFPARFANLRAGFLDQPGSSPRAVTVEDTWLHKGKVVLKFAGVDSIDDAESLRGRLVLIPEEEKVALSAGQYYLWELEGCQVVAESGGERTLWALSLRSSAPAARTCFMWRRAAGRF